MCANRESAFIQWSNSCSVSNVLQMLYPCIDDLGEMEGAVVGTDAVLMMQYSVVGGGLGVCVHIFA